MKGWFRIIISSALLIGVQVFLQLHSAGEAVPIRKTFASFPTTIGQWHTIRQETLSQGVLKILKPTDYLVRTYTNPQGQIFSLYIGYWATQRTGAQIHSPKNCLPGSGWAPLQSTTALIPLPGRHSPITVNRYLIAKDRDRQLVLYWFQSHGEVQASEIGARLAMIKDSILHNRSDGAIVRVISPIYGNPATTFTMMKSYIEMLYPVLAQYLP